MARREDPELASFLQALSAEEMARLLAYLNGEAAFAREQTRLANARAAQGTLNGRALYQCQDYLQRSFAHLQAVLGELAQRPGPGIWEN